jgi:hypothetical protein
MSVRHSSIKLQDFEANVHETDSGAIKGLGMVKNLITTTVLATTSLLIGCATPVNTGMGTALEKTGTAKVTIRFYAQDATLSLTNGVTCKTPCSIIYNADPTRAYWVLSRVTFEWPSGVTSTQFVGIGRSEVNEYGLLIPYALPGEVGPEVTIRGMDAMKLGVQYLEQERALAQRVAKQKATEQTAAILLDKAKEKNESASVVFLTPAQIQEAKQREADLQYSAQRVAEREAAEQRVVEQPSTGSQIMELLNLFAAGYNEAAEERKRNTPVRSAPVQCFTDHMGSISVTNCR